VAKAAAFDGQLKAARGDAARLQAEVASLAEQLEAARDAVKVRPGSKGWPGRGPVEDARLEGTQGAGCASTQRGVAADGSLAPTLLSACIGQIACAHGTLYLLFANPNSSATALNHARSYSIKALVLPHT
jgi:hypothetical protein